MNEKQAKEIVDKQLVEDLDIELLKSIARYNDFKNHSGNYTERAMAFLHSYIFKEKDKLPEQGDFVFRVSYKRNGETVIIYDSGLFLEPTPTDHPLSDPAKKPKKPKSRK